MRQQCSFFKSSIAFAEAVLLFQIQRCICGDSVPFSNPTLFFAPAVLLFQIQRCKRGKNIDSLRIRDSTQMAFSLRVSIPAVRE